MSQEEAKKAFSDRKRSILYLIYQYLNNMGYENAAEIVRHDAHLQPEYAVCDNIDLDTLYLDYCSYYHMKFQKFPKIIKKSNENMNVDQRAKSGRKNKSARAMINPSTTAKMITGNPEILQSSHKTAEKISENDMMHLTDALKVQQIAQINSANHNAGDGMRVYRSLSDYEHFTDEWKEMAEIVCKDLMKNDLGVKWESIYGNTKAVSIIKEAVLLPLQQPALFLNGMKPWRSVLLHGPPGTGKTLIAKALCTETLGRITFFRILPSTIISKWRGESEKTLRVLFEVARFYAPSIIFFDEIEALTSRRDICEHEASKRFKTEFLSLLDGVGDESTNIFILATTNLPWEIDLAFLRRFEKKILTALPELKERKEMIKSYLPAALKISEDTLLELAEYSQGFTGDEIRLGCKEVAMKQIRNASALKSTSEKQISRDEIHGAFKQISPICSKTYQKYIDWNNSNGSKL